MNYTYCEEFKDNVKYQCDNSTMYGFDNGYGAIVEYNEEVDNLWITIIKDIDGHGFNYAYPDFAHGYSRITGVDTCYLIYWLIQINEIKGGHKMTNLETLKQQTEDMEAKLKEMKAEIDRLENGWEMKCPYKKDDEFWFMYSYGDIDSSIWFDNLEDYGRLKLGNAFPTEEAAKLEAKRRNLLTRFRAFRDECNGDWKPNFENPTEEKFSICFYYKEFRIQTTYNANDFATFGYFKNKKDCERAIDLFGDEIKELFMDGE